MVEWQRLEINRGAMFDEILNRYQQQATHLHKRTNSVHDQDQRSAVSQTPVIPSPRTPLEIYKHSIGASVQTMARISEENQIARNSQFALLPN